MSADSSNPRARAEPEGFVRTHRRLLACTFFLSFAGIFSAFMVHGLSVAPEYISTAVIRVRTSGTAAASPAATKRELEACLELLESDLLARRVALRMTDAERAQFFAPFPPSDRRGPPDIIRILVMRHWVKSDDAAAPSIEITFEHPDPMVAARMANLFANECLDVRLQAQAQEVKRELDSLRAQGLEDPSAVSATGNKIAQMNPAFQVITAAAPAHEPYEPKPLLLMSDGLIFGLNLAAAITFITGAILHLRTRPKPVVQS